MYNRSSCIEDINIIGKEGAPKTSSSDIHGNQVHKCHKGIIRRYCHPVHILTNMRLGFNYIVAIKSFLFFACFQTEFKWVFISFAVTSVHCLQHHTKSKPVPPLNHVLYLLFCRLINSTLPGEPRQWRLLALNLKELLQLHDGTWKPWQSLMGKLSQQRWNKALSEAASSRTRTKKCCAILARPENSIHPIKNPLPVPTPCSYLSRRRRTVEGLFSV